MEILKGVLMIIGGLMVICIVGLVLSIVGAVLCFRFRKDKEIQNREAFEKCWRAEHKIAKSEDLM